MSFLAFMNLTLFISAFILVSIRFGYFVSTGYVDHIVDPLIKTSASVNINRSFYYNTAEVRFVIGFLSWGYLSRGTSLVLSVLFNVMTLYERIHSDQLSQLSIYLIMSTENGLDVIGAGYGRTGTLTMKVALEKLGYPTYHMIEAISKPQLYSPLWIDVSQGKPNWDKIFDGFKATVDNPACCWYKDLMKKYPDAKVILTVRDPERWYKSCSDTVYKLCKIMRKAIEHGCLDAHTKQMFDMIEATVWGPTGCFQDRFSDKEWAIENFKQHIEEAKRYVPADKLLVFEVKEGWEPLCKFLGKPVPDEPFPHVNDTAEMQGRIEGMLSSFPPEIRKQIEQEL